MIINLNFDENRVKADKVVRVSGEVGKEVKGFPCLYMGRYSYMGGTSIEAALGNPRTPFRRQFDEAPEASYLLNIGAFCSLSWSLALIMDVNHDYQSVSTSDCELFRTGPSKRRRSGSIIIQNDVWIGQRVTIYGGVTIRNGAVVAGNSVVTKDVPPYCIVGGVPARVIKPRFREETVEKLLRIRWWDWSDEEIRRAGRQGWFEKPVEEFADHFYRPPGEGPAPLEIPPFARTWLFFPDFDEPKHGVWKYVVSSFCRAFAQEEDCALVLFVEQSEKAQHYLQELEQFAENIDARCNLYVYAGKPDEEEAAFARADYYITSRGPHTVKRTCLADQFGVPIISGVDIPIF